jgi:hypothetical protein
MMKEQASGLRHWRKESDECDWKRRLDERIAKFENNDRRDICSRVHGLNIG